MRQPPVSDQGRRLLDNGPDHRPFDREAVTPADAQAAIEDIRTRQEQSGVAELRFWLPCSSLLTAALMVVRHLHGAPVRNRPGTGAALVGLACGIAAYRVFPDLPVRGLPGRRRHHHRRPPRHGLTTVGLEHHPAGRTPRVVAQREPDLLVVARGKGNGWS